MSDDKVTEALSLRASGYVRRWHVLPFHGVNQTVAEHSAQALSLLLILHPGPSVDLIKAVLWHDSAERYVGDVPAPVRRNNEAYSAIYERLEEDFFSLHATVDAALQELTPEDHIWLKAVDVLELVLWCMDQAFLGNRHCEIVLRRAITYIERSNAPLIVKEFVRDVQNEGYRSFA